MGIELPTLRIDPCELLQHVSRVAYRGTPLYYGRDGTNRYDDPAKRYGVLYLGRDLPTALMESVFHKHQWDRDTERSIALAEVQSRLVRAVGVVDDLRLVDLTAEGVMAGYFGLTLEQLASRDYTYTQRCQIGCMRWWLPMVRRCSMGCSTRRATTIPLPASPCSSAHGARSRWSMTSICPSMWIGRISSRNTGSVWNSIPVRLVSPESVGQDDHEIAP